MTELADAKFRLYRSMLRVRMIEEAIAAEYANQEMRCPVHLSIGQEVAAAAVCDVLTEEDWVLSSHRSHAHYLAKGGDLNRMIAELYGKATGCTGGFGGSMHLTDLTAGFIGATPIVGSSIPIAVGAALSAKQQGLDKVVVAFFGDGALETGVAHESMNFASVHQLPILFVCENNLYSVYSPLSVRQPPNRPLCELPKAHGILADSIIGDDALAVRDHAERLVKKTRELSQPTFLEIGVYRWVEHCGHLEDDHLGYRPDTEITEWQSRDALTALEREIPANVKESMTDEIKQEITRAFEFARQSDFPSADALETKVYALNQSAEPIPDPEPTTRMITFAQALNEAQDYVLENIEGTYLMGLGAPDPKGIFGSTLGLQEKFGEKKVFDVPISENALTGVALGSAATGCRPILTHQRVDFALVSIDQIVNQAAKWHYMFGGEMSAPMVIRMIIGRGWGQGPQHSQALHAWFAHIPGLKVVLPATAHDAKGMLIAAVRDENPVIFLEHRWLYNVKDTVPEAGYETPLDKAVVKKQGSDVTLIGISYMTLECLRAADLLAEQGISAEVVDLRSVRPIDYDTLLASVEKTCLVVIADHATLVGSIGSDLAAVLNERLLSKLKQAPIRIGLPDYPVPTSHGLAREYYPSARTIANSVLIAMNSSHLSLDTEPVRAPHDQPDVSFTGPF
ncbi:MAG: thiamine pyrophosphate-dependent enzyme [Proteobacteria bacterium]|nr:thiamine pyrophosphate-dependent enzyme [Pseudomonadota bacterium]